MAKTRRRVSSKKTRKVRKVKRGGANKLEEEFKEAFADYIDNEEVSNDKRNVVNAFYNLSPSLKVKILAELDIKRISDVPKVSSEKAYSYLRNK